MSLDEPQPLKDIRASLDAIKIEIDEIGERVERWENQESQEGRLDGILQEPLPMRGCSMQPSINRPTATRRESTGTRRGKDTPKEIEIMIPGRELKVLGGKRCSRVMYAVFNRSSSDSKWRHHALRSKREDAESCARSWVDGQLEWMKWRDEQGVIGDPKWATLDADAIVIEIGGDGPVE